MPLTTPSNSQSENITYDLDSFTMELQQNRLPTTTALHNKMFFLQFTGLPAPSLLIFDENGEAIWENFPSSNIFDTTNIDNTGIDNTGIDNTGSTNTDSDNTDANNPIDKNDELSSSRSITRCNIVEVAQELFFISLPVLKEKKQSLILIVDNLLGNAVFVHTMLDDSRKEQGYASNIVQHFYYARLDADVATFTPTETRELLGKRVLNIYSDKTAVEHIYINSLWYTYHIHGGVRHGDCDCDEATYIKIREGFYLLAFREKAIDVSIVLILNTDAWHNTGMAIGNNSDGWFTLPIGARMQLLSEMSYPVGYEPR